MKGRVQIHAAPHHHGKRLNRFEVPGMLRTWGPRNHQQVRFVAASFPYYVSQRCPSTSGQGDPGRHQRQSPDTPYCKGTLEEESRDVILDKASDRHR
jgi:hypothetical protein